MASSNTLLSSFKVTVNKSDQTKVDVLTGAWVQGGVTKTSSATAIGGVATPYIIVQATVTDGVLQSISVQAAASATQSDSVVLLAQLEYTADNSRIKQITVHHVGDIHKTISSQMTNRWCAYGVDCVSSIDDLDASDYVEQVCWPSSGTYALQAGAMWVAVAYSGYLVHYQLCIPLEE
jgi:hypothetical protein